MDNIKCINQILLYKKLRLLEFNLLYGSGSLDICKVLI